MKIGVFGNLANNAYIVAKAFRKNGFDAEAIVDDNDTFAMSQPVWEDSDFYLETDLLMENKLSYEDWQRKIREMGWQKPKWLKEVKIIGMHRNRLISLMENPAKYFEIYLRHGLAALTIISGYKPLIETMKEYDVIIAFGLMPICAYFAEKPYIALGYGSDLAIVPFQDKTSYQKSLASLQRAAYKRASYIASSGESRSREAVEKLGLEKKWFWAYAITDTDKYQPIHVALTDVLESGIANKVAGKFLFFTPSRQDFYWKGTDKLLRAYAHLVEAKGENVFMILVGWGKDLGRSKELAKALNLDRYLYFLPYALSKIKLLKFINIADVIIDQFNLGAIGGLAVEAMACAKPVIANYNMEDYKRGLEMDPPPILSAPTEEDIFTQMLKSVNDRTYCTELGLRSRQWVIQNSGFNGKFARKLIHLCQEIETNK